MDESESACSEFISTLLASTCACTKDNLELKSRESLGVGCGYWIAETKSRKLTSWLRMAVVAYFESGPFVESRAATFGYGEIRDMVLRGLAMGT